MSDNYPSDVKLDENPDGSVSFATGVVETIAGLAAQEVEGVASMASTSTGFADMFTRKSTRNFTKGVRVDIDGGTVAVDVTIVVEYGSPVPDVARSIQENVKKAIETMSGLDVRNVDVHVQAVSFERENRAAQELKEQQQKLLENSLRQQDVQQAEAAPEAEEPAAEELGDLPEEEIVEDDGIEEEDDDLEDVDDLDEIDAADLDDLPGEEASEQLDSDGGQPQM
ncbi:MAG TPA: Asp23/Gls24 family envelope stress response protein [Candidatus Pullichristensenella stercorigallinarum]|uniref:Asp23/Gls24 family envelope stress response protein n=1 Tax=Candidatus Pullichristensenella stercorigallinarum TaxID=2840909 RepID=A0A9D0ZNS2_9FIRM|nr:Asp23/Gls24 family envelope stress response protein [Candidatus Pullichristensenella stercorigallinarum]